MHPCSMRWVLKNEPLSAIAFRMTFNQMTVNIILVVFNTIAVAEQGTLIGMLTMDNIGELLRIQAALEGGRAKTASYLSAHAHAGAIPT